jgi:hypothetical protein
VYENWAALNKYLQIVEQNRPFTSLVGRVVNEFAPRKTSMLENVTHLALQPE